MNVLRLERRDVGIWMVAETADGRKTEIYLGSELANMDVLEVFLHTTQVATLPPVSAYSVDASVSGTDEVTTLKERGEVYGDHYSGFENAGRMVAAIVSQFMRCNIPDLPPDIMELIMVAVKVNRLSNPNGRGHADSTHDARVYLGMAQESALLERKRNEHQ